MRTLGIDLGTRRIGLAVSDEEGRIAFPAGFLTRQGGRGGLAALAALIAERGVQRVVVGLPVHMDGRCGPEARAARAFAEALQRETGLPVDLLDERWTTREAERALRATGRSRRRRERGEVDATAAAILLRTYLERRAARAARCADA